MNWQYLHGTTELLCVLGSLNPYPALIQHLQTRAAKGFAILSVFFFLFILPIERIAARETDLVSGRTCNVKKMALIGDSIHAPPEVVYPLESSSNVADRSSERALC